MDGSASAFVKAIDKVGVTSQPAARRFVKVLKPIRVERGRSHAELLPSDTARVEVDAAVVPDLTGRPDLLAAVPGFSRVEVDPRGFRSGSMNELLPDPVRYR
jgi:hypothetical protein